MTTPLLHDELRDTSSETRPDTECPVCSHPRENHDAIAARFCQATTSGALDRGCVCRTP